MMVMNILKSSYMLNVYCNVYQDSNRMGIKRVVLTSKWSVSKTKSKISLDVIKTFV